MQLAMYRGPAKSVWHLLVHWAICLVTGSRYSHCELVIDGCCWTSSNREKGVRGKIIDLSSGHWEVFDVPGDRQREDEVLRWFINHMGQRYDWIGVLRFLLPFLPNHPRRWFCSEACAAALGLQEPHRFTPQMLLDYLKG